MFSLPFEASHSYGTGRCKGQHGHSWTMTVHIAQDDPGDEEARLHAIDMVTALVHELDRRDLNSQLPASIPSAQGVAAWAFERCDMVIPGLTCVTVDMDRLESASCAAD